MGIFLEAAEQMRSPQRHVEIVHTEKQQETVTRRSLLGAHQRWMLLDTPLMKTQQNSSIRVEDLTEMVMGRRRFRLAEQRLVPPEAGGDIANPDDRPCALHGILFSMA